MSTTRPGDEGLVRQRLEERLLAAGRAGSSFSSLLETANLSADRRVVEQALADLEATGVAVEWNRRWFAVKSTDWVAGRVQKLERGDALLRSGADGEVGYFVARRHLKSARDGDLVLARRRTRGRRRRPVDRLPEAVVVKILSPRSVSLVGWVEKMPSGVRLWPFDPRLQQEVILESTQDLEDGTYVVASLDASSAPGGTRLSARLSEVIGDLTSPGVDVLATIRHFDIPDEFPEEVITAASRFPRDPDPDSWAERLDLRQETVVTIDGESARDFDDAISVDKDARGHFRLGVHIADVAHYVREADTLDLEAYRRGTSVYFPDRAVPMLPESLSNGLCSLRPGVPRLTLSVLVEISPAGEILSRRFAESVITSHRRLTYDEARRLLEEERRTEDHRAYGDVLRVLDHASELMQILLARRLRRGSIDFDLPEGDVILDLDGAAVGVRPGARTVAHRIIEEFMIAANESVAQELSNSEVPAIYRIHREPDRSRLHELQELLAPLGIGLDLSEESLHPSVLQEVVAKAENTEFEAFVSSLVLRAMQRARYDAQCQGHYALGSRYYAHFTSPIRRYPDLVVHRQLKSLLFSGDPTEDDQTLAARLPVVADHASMTEARAEAAERLVLQWKVVRYLAGREGEAFEGRVTGVKPYGLFVQLTDLFVDGLLPLAALRDDYYEYRGERHELVGRRGGTFRLADRVIVVLEEVDVTRRRLLLALPNRNPSLR